jgi:hypothetical protein
MLATSKACVQGESRPRQVLLSEAVLADPAVRAIFEERGMTIERVEVRLKGVAKPMALGSVSP